MTETDPRPFIPAKRERPKVDGLGLDRRLMTAERMLTLAGGTRVEFSEPGIPKLSIDCAECHSSVEQLTDPNGEAYPFTPQQFLANVLRHQVMHHGLSLSGGSSE
jgi:hypothetical protein